MTNETMQNVDQPGSLLNVDKVFDRFNTEEVKQIDASLDNPALQAIQALIETIPISAQKADNAWVTFLDNHQKNKFGSDVRCRLAGEACINQFADNRQEAKDLKEKVRAFFDDRIKALNNYDNELRNKEVFGEQGDEEIKDISERKRQKKEFLKIFVSEKEKILDELEYFSGLLENKTDKHKVMLYTMKYDKKRLFDKKEDRDAAEEKASKGTRRDPKNVFQYAPQLSGPKMQKGVCQKTDELIEKNKKSAKKLNQKIKAAQRAQKNDEKFSGVVPWNPGADESVPNIFSTIHTLSTEMDALMEEDDGLAQAFQYVLDHKSK